MEQHEKRNSSICEKKCLILQQIKVEHQRLLGLLQPLSIPARKWEHISMEFVFIKKKKISVDFLFGLPRSPRNHDAIWVVVDRLTKSVNFILIQMNYSIDKLTEIYINEIVRLHGVPLPIVSDRDSRFTLSSG